MCRKVEVQSDRDYYGNRRVLLGLGIEGNNGFRLAVVAVFRGSTLPPNGAVSINVAASSYR